MWEEEKKKKKKRKEKYPAFFFAFSYIYFNAGTIGPVSGVSKVSAAKRGKPTEK